MDTEVKEEIVDWDEKVGFDIKEPLHICEFSSVINVKVTSPGVIEMFPRWFLKGYNFLI